jgi:hydroxymethylpyrimidine/phosphomethylpyrimidine kinase
MGDTGKGLYVPQDVADAIISELVSRADIIAPNAWELQRLTGALADSKADIAIAAAPEVGTDGAISLRTQPVFCLMRTELADSLNIRLGWQFADGTRTGLHIRNNVAALTDGEGADATIHCDATTWAAVLGGATTLSAAIASGDLRVEGNEAAGLRALAAFDVEGLRG